MLSPRMDLTGAASLMNVQTLRCWLHWRCPVIQLFDRGLLGVVTDEGNCLPTSLKICTRRHEKWRAFSSPVSFEVSFPPQSSDDFPGEEEYAEDSSEEPMPKPLKKEELQALLADSERQKLVKKLSEANQLNRFLKRQLHAKEDALVTFKKELAIMELELQDTATSAAAASLTFTEEFYFFPQPDENTFYKRLTSLLDNSG